MGVYVCEREREREREGGRQQPQQEPREHPQPNRQSNMAAAELAKDFAPERLEEIRAVFQELDTDGNGTISLEELALAMERLGGKAVLWDTRTPSHTHPHIHTHTCI